MALRQRPANPVIEQAKSIVMAELTCTPDEAFDLLRRASQRVNLKVSVLAAYLIDQAAAPPDEPRGTPATRPG